MFQTRQTGASLARAITALSLSASVLLPIPAMANAAEPPAASTPAQAPAGSGIFAQDSSLPFHAPDFSRITDADYAPAIEQGIAIQQAEVEAIANNPAPPTFANTIAALESTGQMLDRASAVFDAVKQANTNDTLDQIDQKLAPERAAAADAITLNARLFQRVRALYDSRSTLGLAPDQLQLLTVLYQSMARNGALLSAADKDKLTAINARLSALTTGFGQKLTAATRDAALVVTDKAALAGLSAAEIAAAEKAAAERKLPAGSYVIPLQNTTQQPMLATLENRATRQALFAKSWTRTVSGGPNDTRADIAEIARLRAEKARLLGFPDYASFVLSDQMAKTPGAAIGFLTRLLPALSAEQRHEAAALNTVIRAAGGRYAVTPADWAFYSEKLRKARFDLDEGQIKPYFEINRVLEDGVFYAANQLYGITFTKRTDLPVYQADVSVYEVTDANGSPLALFYFDPWKRDNKQGGAWMSNFVEQSGLLGLKPVIYNVENFAKPAAGQPALISWDDVTTMFHEFGHALHGMFSDQRYPSLAGTNTARDFVEFPSQFNENWASDPKVFAHYARHWQTGAPMPAAMVAKIRQARTFNQGYALGEIVAAALLDLKWHTLPAAAGQQDANRFEAQALGALRLDIAHVPPRYRSSYFRHIWGNDYAAGYYAYCWTEMLDHDAFQWFTVHGGLTRENGQRFRDLVLSRGHSQDYGTMFRAFTGHDPAVAPMLKARGLAPPPRRAPRKRR